MSPGVFGKCHGAAAFMAGLGLLVSLAATARASETENLGIRVLPAPGKVTIDGKFGDWDLSGGIFACGEVEHLRDQFSVWVHAMYDQDNLYVLARWKDSTPLNNPESFGGHSFNGDCLQLRFILFPDTPEQTVTWWDFWRDRNGKSIVDRAWPGPINGVKENPVPNLSDAAEQGVKQAFQIDADGKGYTQELAIPWKLLSASGRALKTGERFKMTVEPNFTAGEFGRITIKDLFDEKAGKPDRIFTFRSYKGWGPATLEAAGKVAPQAERLADGRTFAVSMVDGAPVVDWTGLIRKFEWPGFKPITFTMPMDGYISLNLLDEQGRVARHLLNWDQRAAGTYTVQWDGLSDATYRTPGEPVAAGNYIWSAIAHPGAKMTFRGYASYGGKTPWQSDPASCWLGDHGVPTAVVTDGERMYLACNGAEGGRHLLATDFDGNVIWGLQNTTGAADPESIAVDNGTAYVLHPKSWWAQSDTIISRADIKTGSYSPWQGKKDHLLSAKDIYGDGPQGPDHFNRMDAAGGKIYLTSSDASFRFEDVTDWKAFATQLKSDTPLAKRILEATGPEMPKRLKRILSGAEPEKVFAANGGQRIDPEFANAMNELIDSGDLAPNAANLSASARAQANRAVIDKAFAGAVKPQSPDVLVVLDGASGHFLKTMPLPLGGPVKAVDERRVYVVSGGTQILAVDTTTGQAVPFVKNLANPTGINTDSAGNVVVSLDEPDNQVAVFDQQGKEVKRIGRSGGRPLLGTWQPDGMLHPAGVAVDKLGKLWVMERDRHPKRVSVWTLADGKFEKDFFGPTHYGASGSAINPRDPNLMVGVGCEWRLDPATGKSVCLGAFDRQYHEFATFREGSNGKLYLFTVAGKYGWGELEVFERLGDANYVKRAEFRNEGNPRSPSGGSTVLWTDANGDGKEQPEELQTQPGALLAAGSNGWSMNLGPDMTIYAFDTKDKTLKALSIDGFTAAGAPKYTLAKARAMPEVMSANYEINSGCALPSADNKRILLNLRAKDHPAKFLWTCFDLASGKQLWTYPNPYFQVHGSHQAPAADPGLFRGAYGPVGTATLPGVGDLWFINGNLGEWGVLSADGFYVTRLFNGNVFDWKWPKTAAPGVDMTELPPGSGGEDFGGSVTQGRDGKVYVQSGKAGIWNLELTGLEKTVAIPGSQITLSEDDTKKALALRDQAMQTSSIAHKLAVKRMPVTFTGKLAEDFKGCEIVSYQKTDDSAATTALAHDDSTLYIGWEVKDATPWVNGAKDISQMYASGDTVDLQLGTDPGADSKRTKAAKGDIRLSIGNFEGTPTAVLYRFISDVKKPRTFTSGVIQGYQVDYVEVLASARIKVKLDKSKYVVEAAVPLAALGLDSKSGGTLQGDVGVTFNEASGTRTRLRSYWSNQETGLVDDVVFELQVTPKNWGTMTFE